MNFQNFFDKSIDIFANHFHTHIIHPSLRRPLYFTHPFCTMQRGSLHNHRPPLEDSLEAFLLAGTILGILLLLAMLSLLYEDYPAKKILSVLSLFLYTNLVHYGLLYLSAQGNLLLYNIDRLSFLTGALIECALLYGFYKLVILIKVYLQDNTIAVLDLIPVLLCFLCITFLLCVSLLQAGFLNFYYALIPLLILTFVLLAFFTHCARIIKTRLRLISYQSQNFEKQLEIITASDAAFKSLRHDLKNHLLVLSNFMDHGDLTQAKEYIATIFDTLQPSGELSKTGNIHIDSLVNYKLRGVSDQKIQFNYLAQIPKEMYFDPFDITVILGNLLDNALESISQTPSEAEKSLSVALIYRSGRLSIKIVNTYDGLYLTSGSHFLTRKKDIALHGIGLKNVEMTVKKYGGITEVTPTRTHFTVSVMLYEPDKSDGKSV